MGSEPRTPTPWPHQAPGPAANTAYSCSVLNSTSTTRRPSCKPGTAGASWPALAQENTANDLHVHLEPADAVQRGLVGAETGRLPAHGRSLTATTDFNLVRVLQAPGSRLVLSEYGHLQLIGSAVHGFRDGSHEAKARELEIDVCIGVALRSEDVDAGKPIAGGCRLLTREEQDQKKRYSTASPAARAG